MWEKRRRRRRRRNNAMSHTMVCDARKNSAKQTMQCHILRFVMRKRVQAEKDNIIEKPNAMSHIMVCHEDRGMRLIWAESGQVQGNWKKNNNERAPRYNSTLRDYLTETLRRLTELQWNDWTRTAVKRSVTRSKNNYENTIEKPCKVFVQTPYIYIDIYIYIYI